MFYDGEFENSMPTVTCAFKNGLKKGDYLIMFSVEFTSSHPERRILVSTYCEHDTKMVRLDAEKFSYSRFKEFEYALYERRHHKEHSIEMV